LKYELFQNYPNPFNPSTTIRYDLARDTRVTLKVYNLLGQEVKTLVNEFQTAGPHDVIWDGTNNQNHAVSSGNYLCRFTAGKFTKMMKVMLLK
jgi:flagellar hook assembly protein FlgD